MKKKKMLPPLRRQVEQQNMFGGLSAIIAGTATLADISIGATVAAWGAVGAAGATAYSAVEQKKAADNAAAVDTATANYNAKYDTALAEQLDLDTQQNIDTERRENATYISREAASYAGAGVLSDAGSPLHAQITNAGRLEQKIQQEWVNSQQQQEQYYSQGKMGQLAGQAQASADRLTGSLALINGASTLAGMGMKDYQSGIFNLSSANG